MAKRKKKFVCKFSIRDKDSAHWFLSIEKVVEVEAINDKSALNKAMKIMKTMKNNKGDFYLDIGDITSKRIILEADYMEERRLERERDDDMCFSYF